MRPVLARLALVLLATTSLGADQTEAAECPWLSLAVVDSALPAEAPWSVINGGPGSCRFLSRPGTYHTTLGITQMVRDSEAEARDFVRGMSPEMAKSYDIEAAPSLGEHGFFYQPRSTAENPAQSVHAVGHSGRLAYLAMLTRPYPLEPSYRNAFEGLLVGLLTRPAATEPVLAATCPWFDATLLAQVLPGSGLSQQVFGENSCLATDQAGGTLIATIHTDGPSTRRIVDPRDSDCTWEDLPDLGPRGAVGSSCTGGRPRVSLRLNAANRLVSYSLVLESGEPSATIRQALIAMARAVHARQR